MVALITLGFVFLAIILLFRNKQRPGIRLPPSPASSLPIIGHLHLLGKLPHHSLFNLSRQYGGLIYLKLGSKGAIVVSKPEIAKQVLKTHDHIFASRPTGTTAAIITYDGKDMTFAPYGEHWRNMRKICTLQMFTSKRVEMFQPLRKLELSMFFKHLLEIYKNKEVANMSAKITDVTFNTMARITMNKSFSEGSSPSEKKRALFFKGLLKEGLELTSATHIGDFVPYLKWLDWHIPRMKALHVELDEYMQKEVEEHRYRWEKDHVVKDLMDVMLSVDLDDTTLKAIASEMMAAGMDTSAITVEWALVELVKNPDIMVKVQEELDEVVGRDRLMEETDVSNLKYLQAVVKETLRLHPPTPLLVPHMSVEECMIDGYTVPANTRLFVNAYAIGRDEEVWSDPLRFHPKRFVDGPGAEMDVKGQSFEIIPFGAGRRMCPGMTLGLAMVHYMLGSLVHAFDWHMPHACKPEEMDMAETFGITVSRTAPLMLMPSPRLSNEAYVSK